MFDDALKAFPTKIFFDGFFIYGFIFAWAIEDLFDWVDPKKRDMSERDYYWFESLWLRVIYNSNHERNIFSNTTPEPTPTSPAARWATSRSASARWPPRRPPTAAATCSSTT